MYINLKPIMVGPVKYHNYYSCSTIIYSGLTINRTYLPLYAVVHRPN